jgi:hypothetical protein
MEMEYKIIERFGKPEETEACGRTAEYSILIVFHIITLQLISWRALLSIGLMVKWLI